MPVTGQLPATFDTAIQPGTASVAVKQTDHGHPVVGNLASETAGSSVTFTPSTRWRLDRVHGDGQRRKERCGHFDDDCVHREVHHRGPGGVPVHADGDDDATDPVGRRGHVGDNSGPAIHVSTDGVVTGIRYYRDAANTGTHTGKL